MCFRVSLSVNVIPIQENSEISLTLSMVSPNAFASGVAETEQFLPCGQELTAFTRSVCFGSGQCVDNINSLKN